MSEKARFFLSGPVGAQGPPRPVHSAPEKPKTKDTRKAGRGSETGRDTNDAKTEPEGTELRWRVVVRRIPVGGGRRK